MLKKEDELALKVTKEIVVKFIEVGRVSPANFDELFPAIYTTVLASIRTPEGGESAGSEDAGDAPDSGDAD